MYDLKKLYDRVLNKALHLSKPKFTDIYRYEVLNEQVPAFEPPAGFNFKESDESQSGDWDQLQLSLFDRQREGSGRGEYSIAALLLSKLDPTRYNEFIQAGVDSAGALGTLNAAKYIDEIGMVQGGSESFDVIYPNTNYKYEIKEVGAEKKEVRTGVEGKRASKALLDKIHRDVNMLYDKYMALTPETKSIVNQFKTAGGATIGSILEAGHAYFTINPGELPTGVFFSREKKPKIVKRPRKVATPEPEPTEEQRAAVPKLSFLADLVFELVMDPRIEEIVPDTAKRVKEIYNTDDFNARYIDAYIRNYLNVDADTQDPKVKLSDFVLYCSLSIFRNDAAFKKEVQDYFTPGTEPHRRALKEALPVTGIFAVTPEGYFFNGTSNLEQGFQITRITAGTFKIGRRQKEEPEVAAP